MDRAAAVRYAIEWLDRSVIGHVAANSSVANVTIPATTVAACGGGTHPAPDAAALATKVAA